MRKQMMLIVIGLCSLWFSSSYALLGSLFAASTVAGNLSPQIPQSTMKALIHSFFSLRNLSRVFVAGCQAATIKMIVKIVAEKGFKSQTWLMQTWIMRKLMCPLRPSELHLPAGITLTQTTTDQMRKTKEDKDEQEGIEKINSFSWTIATTWFLAAYANLCLKF